MVLSGSSIILSALAQDGWTTPGPQPPAREPPWMSQLTDEQKQEIEQLTQSLRDAGATPQEIRDAVNAKLQEWGIQLPEQGNPQHGPFPWMNQLTDDQREEMQQLLESLKESGATPEEIRDAVSAKLAEWGIDLPEDNGGHPPFPSWMSQLTGEQKEEIQQLIRTLTDTGVSPEEIRNAVNAKLQEWGIEAPTPPENPEA